MGTVAGPNIIDDALVVAYDTGYGVADNNTATRLYPGEPTTNYADDTVDAQGGWTGSYSLIDSATKKFRFNVSNFAANPGAGWRCFVWDMRAHAGSAVTISATVEIPDDSPGDFAWIMIGQSSSGSNGTSSANYHGYSATSERYQKNTKTTERITWSGTIGNTGTANQPNGYIGFTIWYNGGTPGTNSYVDISNIQIEKISHATPFVNGSRSNTASLIDLKRTADISLGNMSFDSTGQPEFDGTDDYVDLGTDIEIADMNQGWTAEYVVNTDSASTLQHFNGCEEDVHNAGWLALLSSKMAVWDRSANVWKYGDTVFASDTWYHVVFVQETGTSMQFYVNGVAEGGDHASFTWTADKSAFFARYIGRYEYGGYSRYWNGHIPITRLYSKPLTAAEIKQNYNAFKKRFDI